MKDITWEEEIANLQLQFNKMKETIFVMFMLIEILNAQGTNRNLIDYSKTQLGITDSQNSKRTLIQEDAQNQQFYLGIPYYQYLSLLVYLLGFRISGMENLLLWQILHLVQTSTKTYYFSIGNFIHGYTNPQVFAFQGSAEDFLFQKLNFMWEFSVIAFIISMFVNYIIVPGYQKILSIEDQKKTKEIEIQPLVLEKNLTEQTEANIYDKNSPFSRKQINFQMSSSKIINRMSKKRLNSIQTQPESIYKEMVHQSKQTLGQKNLKQNDFSLIKIPSQIFSSQKTDKSALNKDDKRQIQKIYIKLLLYSKILLKQVVFNILVNSICITIFGVIQQIQSQGTNSEQLSKLSFSACIILFSEFMMFLIVFNLLLNEQNGVGENKSKFKRQTFGKGRIYWLITIIQRIFYSTLIASKWKLALACICFFKFLVLILAKVAKLWTRSAQYYRSLFINFLQFLLLLIVCFDYYYLSNTKRLGISKENVGWMLMAILFISLLTNLIFILKDLGILRAIYKLKTHLISNTFIEQKQTPQERQKIPKNNQQTQKNSQQMSRRVKFAQKMSQKQIARTLIQKQIDQKIKSNLKKNKIFQAKTEGLIRKDSLLQSNSAIEDDVRVEKQLRLENIINQRKYNEKSQILIVKSQKHVSKLTDAVRAQNPLMLIQQTRKQDQDSDDIDLVSIKCQRQK